MRPCFEVKKVEISSRVKIFFEYSFDLSSHTKEDIDEDEENPISRTSLAAGSITKALYEHTGKSEYTSTIHLHDACEPNRRTCWSAIVWSAIAWFNYGKSSGMVLRNQAWAGHSDNCIFKPTCSVHRYIRITSKWRRKIDIITVNSPSKRFSSVLAEKIFFLLNQIASVQCCAYQRRRSW